jgi:hypothetical protein
MILVAAAFCCAAGAAPPAQFAPNPQGFAPPQLNLLSPLLSLAPPGQAGLALRTFETIHQLDRRLILHPDFSPALQMVINRLPAPELIPIEMPGLATSTTIPWQGDLSGKRYLAVEGRPEGDKYIYDLAENGDPPREPGHFAALLTVSPQTSAPGGKAETVGTAFQALLYVSDAMTPPRALQTGLGFQSEIYGSMAPPWDGLPGVFNQHDHAALGRLQRDLPATAELLNSYFKIYNLLDEFSGPFGPWVLVNLAAAIRPDAMTPFPHLRRFWLDAARHLAVDVVVRDERGRRWIIAGLHRGRITFTFLLQQGMLAPMDGELRPAGPPLAIEQIRAGRFYLDGKVSVQRFGMRMGLSGVRFEFTYNNRGGEYGLDSHMTGVPTLIAPPVVHRLTMLLAGKYLATLAHGNGGHGIATTFSAQPGPQGGTLLSGSIGAELREAPTLALLTRIASALAPDYGSQVREEQRRLMAEFFDAFDTDYRRIRPLLLRNSEKSVR